MKKLYSLLALTFVFAAISAQAAPRPGFDGCYQLYTPGAMYPAFCLQGTAEEGINGSGVRLVLFRTNTNRLDQCLVSTSSRMTETSFAFELNGEVEMILQNVQTNNGRKEGDAIIGSTSLKFMEIDWRNTDRLMDIVNSNADCFKR